MCAVLGGPENEGGAELEKKRGEIPAWILGKGAVDSPEGGSFFPEDLCKLLIEPNFTTNESEI